jgi:hypothetical protein
MQNTVVRGLAVVLVGGGLISTGCATTQEYAGFAQAGSSYAAAVDRLLVASRDTAIDATSNKMLQNDAIANTTLEQYKTQSEPDLLRLEVIEGLRLHADLLGKYFRTMSKLTGSTAPADIKASLDGTVDGLNSVGKQLRGAPLLSADAKSAIGAIGQLAVAAKIRGSLRDELQRREATLRQELVLQEHLLNALAEAIAQDLKITAQAREQRLVIQPLIQPTAIPAPDPWIASRRTVMLTNPEIAELQSASRAAADMRETFEDLIAGRLSMARLLGVIADLDGIISIAEHLLAKSK